MKKTLIKIIIIFLLLCSYCTAEMLFLNSFTEEMFEKALRIQSEDDSNEMNKIYLQMDTFLEDRKIWLAIIMPKTEMEMIRVSLGRLRDYLLEDRVVEARVSAGEIASYLSEINGSLALKK